MMKVNEQISAGMEKGAASSIITLLMRGFFLVLEGPEGAGKSTLAATLAARATGTGAAVVAVREPGGTHGRRGGPRHRAGSRRMRVGPEAELLLMLAARADLVRRVIGPALEAGSLVIADRFDLSTEAYQVAGRGLPADLVAAGEPRSRPAGWCPT